MNYYLGIDFGTSGVRAIVIDEQNTVHVAITSPYSATSASLAANWRATLFEIMEQIPEASRRCLRAIAINGTSGTALLCDHQGTPITEPLLYNDARGKAVLNHLVAIVPTNHPVFSATSTLAKLAWWYQNLPELSQTSRSGCLYLMHQADWVAYLLHGKLGITDYHNALKLGFDVENLKYPNWLTQPMWGVVLPEVVSPGTPIAQVHREACHRFQLPVDCTVCAGTTDSIAAFLASGANRPGEAVTSLGSTLVLKLLSTTRVDDARYGIYSHRLGDLWLVGGASNTGGAVLKQFFTDAELAALSQHIDPHHPSPLDYYPLTQPGDRFPINDPDLPPRLDPRPDNPVDFLHGLLESIARIEAQGYHLLQTLGATPISCVYTAGGGAQNPVWTAIRQRYLGVPCRLPLHTEAAYGSALLAHQSLLR
ncbi:MAG: FGGY-family carbohydrate kinase [Cyanobacteria bacterium]|nr:FGGY-family carbohydrate kinase [Cyanobacteriota bacterium]MDW8202409.1 FGGY-family carbohydrate kinase [Cyanobacteriota bacterium SKYGB_h_bin112]